MFRTDNVSFKRKVRDEILELDEYDEDATPKSAKISNHSSPVVINQVNEREYLNTEI